MAGPIDYEKFRAAVIGRGRPTGGLGANVPGLNVQIGPREAIKKTLAQKAKSSGIPRLAILAAAGGAIYWFFFRKRRG